LPVRGKCAKKVGPEILGGLLYDLLEAEADFVGGLGADGAGDFEAIFEEDGSGPELYAEGAAKAAAGAVFDFDVFDGRELVERFGDQGGCGLAVATPSGAEFEKDGTLCGVDLFTGGAGV
jgi:hypothetical protein